MYDIRNMVLDGSDNGYDFLKETEKEIKRQNENRIASHEISLRLTPLVEKIYKDAGLESPFKDYINTECEPI